MFECGVILTIAGCHGERSRTIEHKGFDFAQPDIPSENKNHTPQPSCFTPP